MLYVRIFFREVWSATIYYLNNLLTALLRLLSGGFIKKKGGLFHNNLLYLPLTMDALCESSRCEDLEDCFECAYSSCDRLASARRDGIARFKNWWRLF